MIRGLLSTVILGLATFAVASSSSAGEILIPAAWEGVWDITNTTRPCGETGGDIEMEADTLCAGDPFNEGKPGEPVPDCTGTATDTEVDIVCTYTAKLPKPSGCTVTVTITITGTRTGETYTATETVESDYSIECGMLDTCEETVTDGTRTGADPDCMVLPTESTTWSRIKSGY